MAEFDFCASKGNLVYFCEIVESYFKSANNFLAESERDKNCIEITPDCPKGKY